MTSVQATLPDQPLTADELDALGVTCSLPVAARALSISRAYAYKLAGKGRFPVRTIHVGGRIVVDTDELRALIKGHQ